MAKHTQGQNNQQKHIITRNTKERPQGEVALAISSLRQTVKDFQRRRKSHGRVRQSQVKSLKHGGTVGGGGETGLMRNEGTRSTRMGGSNEP